MAFTPGAAETLAAARELIADSWSAGNSKASAVSGTVSDLKASLPSISSFIDLAAGSATSPAVVEPGVSIPAEIDVTDITDTFKTQYLELVALLADKFTAFETAYFPNDAAAYAAAQSWISAAIDDPLAELPASPVVAWAAAVITNPTVTLPSSPSTAWIAEALADPTTVLPATAVSAWIAAAAADSRVALPPAVASQLYTDAVDPITAEAARAADSVVQLFAARRFPLPPDAAAAAILQINQKAQDEAAEAGRKITAMSVDVMKFSVEKGVDQQKLATDVMRHAADKAVETQHTAAVLTSDQLKVAVETARGIQQLAVDMLKFAVEKAVAMRQLAIGSAVDYIKALASGPDMATRVVGIGYDAQSKLISSASQFYGARVEVAKLATQNSQFNVSTALQAGEKNQLKDIAILDNRVKAILAEAQALASMAAALYNNVHASAGTQYSVNVNENSTV